MKNPGTFYLFVALLLTIALPCRAQVTDIVLDPTPGGNPCTGIVLTKNIGFFTSDTALSVIVGRGESSTYETSLQRTLHRVLPIIFGREASCSGKGGIYLENSSTGDINGPWRRSLIDEPVDSYERAIPFTYGGDTYPGIIISNGHANKTTWYHQPKNGGGNPLNPWTSVQLIASRSCHDIHLADIDGDDKLDVVCSSGGKESTTNGYIAFQNAPNSWDEHDGITPKVGDGVGVVYINGIPDIVSAYRDGNVYLYWNPRNDGQNARTTPWKAFVIGPGVDGNSIEGGNLGGTPVVYECSNEETWTHGCAVLFPNGTNYKSAWKFVDVDPTYRAVHEINGSYLLQGKDAYTGSGSNLTPAAPIFLNGFIAAEQEQVSSACNSGGYNDHPSISGCRVTYFRWNGGTSFTPELIFNLGTQDQSVFPYGKQLAVVGSNHNYYNAKDIALHMWLINP
jgi:hypothetical protein